MRAYVAEWSLILLCFSMAAAIGGGLYEDLIDEYHLFVNPGPLGKGMSIFNGLIEPRKFVMKKATPFNCGIVVLHYEPTKA